MSYEIIDCDTHITEPRDVWTARVPAQYREQVPHVVRNDKGFDVWLLDGVQIYTAGVTALAGWPEPFPSGPPTYEDMHPAAYDASARLKLMDGEGIWAQVLYPNVAGFGSQKFLQIKDDALKLICVEAYNDFLRDWASADPRRLITIMSMPFWDVDACVKEIERGAAAGHRGVLFTGEPQRFGLPFLGEKHWDPLVVGGAGRRPRHPLPHRQRRRRQHLQRRARRCPRHGGDVCHQFGRPVPEERPAGLRSAAERRPPPLPGPEVRLGRERDRLDPVRARGGRPQLPRSAAAPHERVGPAAVGVLRPAGVRVPLVRDGAAATAARRPARGQPALRDRLSAPHLPVRRRGRPGGRGVRRSRPRPAAKTAVG